MATFQITGPDGKKYRVTGDSPAGAMAALKKAIGENAGLDVSVDPATNQPRGVPQFVPPGVEGYDPQTGEVTPQIGKLRSALHGAADTTTLGWGDEAAAYIGSKITDVPRERALSEIRDIQEQAQEQNPNSYLAGQIAGGVAQGVAAGPVTLSARAAPTLGARMAAGMGDGAIMGALYGAGSGEDTTDRAIEAAKGLGIGLAAGAAFPLVSAGASGTYSRIADALAGRKAARDAGTNPEVLRMLSTVMDADGTRGPIGQNNMARAGQDAMLADAGPNARAVLDTAIQRGGPGGAIAREAVTSRTNRAAQAITDALDNTLGAPEGVTAARTAIRRGSAAARGNAYDQAYAAAIDYADPRGRTIEGMIRNRVPGNAISEANKLMRLDGHESAQILARIADDGSVAFERMPDVRQIDYITRALNQAAQGTEGTGALGGQTPLGRAYEGLSREIRDQLRDLVPEYGQALETAADPISRSKAVDLGSRLLSSSITRDQAEEAIRGMTGPERQALAQGVRSRLDDMMANVTRTVQDGDTTAREAIKGLKELSSRANREKLATAIGQDEAEALFSEIDRATTAFELRASVAENSKTFARQATDRRVNEMTEPGAIGTLLQVKPLKGTQRIAQALTGQTPEQIAARQEGIYSDLARVLTQPQSQPVFDAIDRLGRTDQATRLMSDRIARALLGPRFAYPTIAPATDMIGR
jgi:hypothetical protein